MTFPVGLRGRVTAVALLLIPIILLINFVVGPLIEAYTGHTDDIVAMQEDIIRYRRVIGELPSLKAAAAKLEQAKPLAPFLLTGSNAAIAAAGLQRRLQDVAKEHGVRIVSLRVQPPVPEGPLERISVQARLQTNGRGLRDALYGLEAGTPYLFVDSLNINTGARRRGSNYDNLQVRMTLSGLRTPDRNKGAGATNG